MFPEPNLDEIKHRADLKEARMGPLAMNFGLAIFGTIFAIWAHDKTSATIFLVAAVANGFCWELHREEVREARKRLEMFSRHK